MITLWGSKNSGKTVFLTALYHTILNGKKKWKIYPSDDLSGKFIDDRQQELVVKHEFPGPTSPEDKDRRFGFDIQIPRISMGGSKKIRLDFLDPAGEIFEKPEKYIDEFNEIIRTITKAKGLICLIDPIRQNPMGYFPLILRNFQKIQGAFFPEASVFREIPIPVAICISKMDENDNFVNAPNNFDIGSYAKKIMGDSAYNQMINYLKIYKIFGISSIGWDNDGKCNYYVDDEGYSRPVGEPKPVNVFEALKWLIKKAW